MRYRTCIQYYNVCVRVCFPVCVLFVVCVRVCLGSYLNSYAANIYRFFSGGICTYLHSYCRARLFHTFGHDFWNLWKKQRQRVLFASCKEPWKKNKNPNQPNSNRFLHCMCVCVSKHMDIWYTYIYIGIHIHAVRHTSPKKKRFWRISGLPLSSHWNRYPYKQCEDTSKYHGSLQHLKHHPFFWPSRKKSTENASGIHSQWLSFTACVPSPANVERVGESANFSGA